MSERNPIDDYFELIEENRRNNEEKQRQQQQQRPTQPRPTQQQPAPPQQGPFLPPPTTSFPVSGIRALAPKSTDRKIGFVESLLNRLTAGSSMSINPLIAQMEADKNRGIITSGPHAGKKLQDPMPPAEITTPEQFREWQRSEGWKGDVDSGQLMREGLAAAWNSDYDSGSMRYGVDYINRYREINNLPALNREDAKWYERTGLFLGGLAMDIFLDPITYTPPGLVAAPIRGAIRAAKTAQGMAKAPAAVKGLIEAPAEVAYKAGRFSGQPKPVGLRQWSELSNYDAVAQGARQSGLSMDEIFDIYRGALSTDDAAAALAARGQTKMGMETADDVYRLVERLNMGGPLTLFRPDALGHAYRLHLGVMSSPTAGRYWLNKSPQTGAPQTLRNVNDGAAPSDGISEPTYGVHNTFGQNPYEILGLQPGATRAEIDEAWEMVARNTDVPQDFKEEAFGAWMGLLDTGNSARDLLREIDSIIQGLSTSQVPAKVAAALPDTPPQTLTEELTQIRDIVAKLADADARLGIQAGDEFNELALRSQILDNLATRAIPEELGTTQPLLQAQRQMLLNPNENPAEIWFGTNKTWSGIDEILADRIGGVSQSGTESVYSGIKALAQLPLDIPGYSARARAIVRQVEAAAPEDKARLINELSRQYEEGLIRVGGIEPPSAQVGIDERALGVASDAAGGTMSTQATGRSLRPDSLGEDANLIDIRTVDDIGDVTPDTPRVSRETSQQDSLWATADSVGKYVNIFGDIVDDPIFDMTRAIQGAASKSLDDISKGITPGAEGRAIGDFLSTRPTLQTTANIDGIRGATPILGRALDGRVTSAATKNAQRQLLAPNVPRELDDIYDHVVGFARKPLEIPEYIDALKRIAATEAAVRPLALQVIKKYGLNDPTPKIDEFAEYYAKYAEKFVDRSASWTDDIGIDIFGRVFRNEAPPGDATAREAKNLESIAFAEKTAAKGLPLERLQARQTIRTNRAESAVEEARALANAEIAKNAERISEITNNPLLRRSTDGAWIADPKALIKVVTQGDVAAAASNLVEEAKIVGVMKDGLDQVLPSLKYNQLDDVISETTTMRSAQMAIDAPGTASAQFDKTMAEVKIALKQEESVIFNVIESVGPKLAKKLGGKASFREVIAELRGRKGAEFFKYDEGRFQPREMKDWESLHTVSGSRVPFTQDNIDITAMTERVPWVSMQPLQGALDEIMHAAKIPVEDHAALRPLVWNSILDNLSRPGGQLQLNYSGVLDAIADTPYRTGATRQIEEFTAASNSVEAELRKVSSRQQKWNGSYHTKLEAAPEEISYKPMGTRIFDREKTLDDYLEDVERIFGDLKLTHADVDDAWLRKTADVIARHENNTKMLSQSASGEMLFDYIKSRLPQLKTMLTADNALRIARQDAISDYTLFRGDDIAVQARNLKVDTFLFESRQVARDMLEKVPGTARNDIREASLAGFKASIARLGAQGASKKVPGTKWRTYQQNAVYTAYKAAKSVINQKFAPGSIENWNATVMAMRDMRALLRESGVVEVTSIGRWGGKISAKETADHDFGYITWLDVMDSTITASGRTGSGSGIPEDVYRVALDLHRVDGMTFPQNVLAEAGLMAMKMKGSGMADETARIAWLYDFMRDRIAGIKGFQAYAEQITPGVDTPTAQLVATLARGIGSNEAIASMTRKHINSGALAAAVAEKNSAKIAEPILSAVESVAKNIYATSGDVAEQLTKSVDDLRRALVQNGYGKGSLEGIISMKSLERTIVENVPTNIITGARLQERMARAAATPQTARVTANAERANVSNMVQDVADDITIADLMRRWQTAIADDAPENVLRELVGTTMHMADHKINTAQELLRYVMLQPNSLRFTPKALQEGAESTRNSRVLERELGIKADVLDDELTVLARQVDDLERAGTAPEDMKEVIDAYAAKQEEYAAAREAYENARATRETAEVEDAASRIVDPEQVDTASRMGIAQELESFADRGRSATFQRAMSVRGRQEDIWETGVAIRTRTDDIINETEKHLEAFARKYRGANEEDIRNLLVQAFRQRMRGGPEGMRVWSETLQENQKVMLDDFMKSLGHLFDEKTLSRTGLDSRWIDKYLRQSVIAGAEKARLTPKGRNPIIGKEIERAYARMIIDMLEAGPDAGGADWLTTFKGLSQGIYNSTILPTIAADFTANFSSKGKYFNITPVEARGNKWVRIRGGEDAGNLARFLDPDAYYPQDIARQMANMQKVLDVRTAPDNLTTRKALTFFDRTNSIVKSFLTLWAPAHHIVSIMGEAFMNALRGETSLKNAFYSARMMYRGGDISANPLSALRHNKNRALDIFNELKIKGAPEDATGAIKSIVRGEDGKFMSFTDEQLFDFMQMAGIRINNNSVEDYTYQVGQLLRKGNLLKRLVTPITAMNRGLGEFASRRDNFFRFQHAIGILRGTNPRTPKSFRSVDEAMDYVRREIFIAHPTVQSLAPFERNIMRRVFFFYTWQRVALNNVFETLIEDPYRLTIPAKAIYSASEAMGGDPQGPGMPSPDDPTLPTWAKQHILGPVWYGENGEINYISLNAPQLDLFETFFGGFGWDSGIDARYNLGEIGTEFMSATVPQLSPWARLLGEGFSQRKYSAEGRGDVIEDWPQHIFDTLGGRRLSVSLDYSPFSAYGPGPRTDWGNMSPAEIEFLQRRTRLNYLTGIKWDEKSRFWRVAQIERDERQNRVLERMMREEYGIE